MAEVLQPPLNAVKSARENLDKVEEAIMNGDHARAAVWLRDISDELGYAATYQILLRKAELKASGRTEKHKPLRRD